MSASWVLLVIVALSSCEDDLGYPDEGEPDDRYLALCERAMRCSNGNDRDRRACVEHFERCGQLAAVYGCGDTWDRELSCYVQHNQCVEVGPPVYPETDLALEIDHDSCRAEDVALWECMYFECP